jgi:DeoR family transcriptional regulator, aga operon transcriptional repressor
MRQTQRLDVILEELSGNGNVSVTDLASHLGASASTIRRDLKLLETHRLLHRTHGGAVSEGVAYELPLRYKAARNQEEKRRIAREAVQRAGDGMAVGLTGGTTTTEVGRALVDRQRLTVVTNALNVAAELAIRPNMKLVVTGGYARAESYELVGPLAESALAGLNLDVVFVGVDGIECASGLTTHHEVEASTNLALIERAKMMIVVADSSKIGRVAFSRICDVNRVHELITDEGARVGAPKQTLSKLEDLGITVTVV